MDVDAQLKFVEQTLAAIMQDGVKTRNIRLLMLTQKAQKIDQNELISEEPPSIAKIPLQTMR